jgi:hypothetical protein
MWWVAFQFVGVAVQAWVFWRTLKTRDETRKLLADVQRTHEQTGELLLEVDQRLDPPEQRLVH